MTNKIDKLEEMFKQQTEFMELLKEKRTFPDYPVNLSSKEGQKIIKSISHECMEELFESIQHLKNSKTHRKTEISHIDKDMYLEELVDSLHYFFEIVIVSGISVDELHAAYMKKGNVNVSRIMSGY